MDAVDEIESDIKVFVDLLLCGLHDDLADGAFDPASDGGSVIGEGAPDNGFLNVLTSGFVEDGFAQRFDNCAYFGRQVGEEVFESGGTRVDSGVPRCVELLGAAK